MLIALRQAGFGYDGKPAISDLHFEVGEGDYLCVVGENGSGKSTLVKGLVGLLPPLSGSVVMGDGIKQTEVGYLPQQTAAQRDFPASALEVALSGRMGKRGLRPFYTREDRAQALANLEALGALGLKNRCYRELSGGQQQRVLLARALCAGNRLLVLDEPVAGLDPLAAQEMYALIRRVNRDMGITIIMVSHDIRSAIRHATLILHLDSGQSFFGPTRDYLATAIGSRFAGDAMGGEGA